MGGTVNYFISFFLFWLGSLPFIWFPVHKIRHLFTVKAVVAPTAGIALFIWALVRAGGGGPVIHQPATASGSKLAWGIVTGIMGAISNFATLIVNVSWSEKSITSPLLTISRPPTSLASPANPATPSSPSS